MESPKNLHSMTTKKRCKECFNEHLNRESQKLGIKEKRDKGVER